MTLPATIHAELQEAVASSNALACLSCGKCTSVCPLATFGRQYSPRINVTRTIRQDYDTLLSDPDLWSCLTCQKCDAYCPAGVSYLNLMAVLRSKARQNGFTGECSHAGALQSLARLMVNPDLKQNRLDWLPEQLKTSREGDILYYVGCTPYFDALFTNLNLHTTQAAVSSIALLNELGIVPALMADERCCGHDLYWNGDVDNFRRLAEANCAAIENTGAKLVLFSCAECLSAFKNLYKEHGLGVSADLQHISEYLAGKVDSGDLILTGDDVMATYHDPCRLGRHLGIYEAPRKLLKPNGNNQLPEMSQNKGRALCCGVSAWMNCDTVSKSIQIERLKQARATGAEVLAIACPKCQIHLLCAQHDQGIGAQNAIEIRDIATIVLGRIAGNSVVVEQIESMAV